MDSQTFRRLVLDNPALLERLGGLEREAFMETRASGGVARQASRCNGTMWSSALAEARTQRQQRLL